MNTTRTHRTKAVVAAVALLASAGASVTARAQQPAAPKEYLIQNATVMTVTKGVIENGSVLIRDGKIAQVGKNLKGSANATVIDAAGKFVTPGVIDCHSHIAVDGSVNEGSLSVTSMVRVADVIDPTDSGIFIGLSGGVTASNILHGSANAIGGQNAVIKMKPNRPVDEVIYKNAPPGIKFALGENPKRSNFGGGGAPARYPRTRMGVEDVIREAFTKARDYKAVWDRYNADVKVGKKTAVLPRRDLQLEPLVEVLEGKRLVHSHCYRADEILMLIRVARDFKFRIATFQHVLEGYKVAKEIAAAGAGASTFQDYGGYKVEAFDATPYNTAIMWKAGINVSLNSDDGERQRRLNTDAARAVRYGGVPEDEALKMITINPAKQLGIDRWTGSLEAGKDADVVIWSAHPLSAYAVAEKVFVDGQLEFDRQTAVRDADARRAESARLVEQEKADKKAKPAATNPDAPAPAPKPKHGLHHDDGCEGGEQ
ncbi:MAG: amidohydrolase [Blastocatellia bacterium]|nr:amidohydrolase [Blastocatellia bacterium]